MLLAQDEAVNPIRTGGGGESSGQGVGRTWTTSNTTTSSTTINKSLSTNLGFIVAFLVGLLFISFLSDEILYYFLWLVLLGMITFNASKIPYLH